MGVTADGGWLCRLALGNCSLSDSEAVANVSRLVDEGPIDTLCFASEKQGLAEFFWIKQSIESLLRRTEEK